MNRLHITIFALLLLLGQWGSFDHAYHQHDSGEVCDFCLSAQALDHAISASTPLVFATSFQIFQPRSHQLHTSDNSFHYFTARAPPRFI